MKENEISMEVVNPHAAGIKMQKYLRLMNLRLDVVIKKDMSEYNDSMTHNYNGQHTCGNVCM